MHLAKYVKGFSVSFRIFRGYIFLDLKLYKQQTNFKKKLYMSKVVIIYNNCQKKKKYETHIKKKWDKTKTNETNS